jgi:predicted acyl esterase
VGLDRSTIALAADWRLSRACKLVHDTYKGDNVDKFLRLKGLGVSIAIADAVTGCGGDSDPAPAAVVESAPVVQDGVSCTTAMVPTRDGTKLYTEIYRPASMTSGTKLPVIISRSPYGKLLAAGCFSAGGSMASYVGIFQEVRGTASSEGNSPANPVLAPRRVAGQHLT